MDNAITQPISAIIPTANRAKTLLDTLTSLSNQNVQPAEIIIIDASEDESTQAVCKLKIDGLLSTVIYKRAEKKGAATQRNQGVDIAGYNFILLCDDDILFEPNCMERLWQGINFNPFIGGVNAMITNQRYLPPGKFTRIMYRIMHTEKLSTYAGKCIGPAWNLLPEDNDALPELVKTEWLNSTCTLYKKEALPSPVFSNHFQGYSLMEDLTLSLVVGRNWSLYNARTARIFHDSQPGSHKSSSFNIARMELVNRHYVMRYVLHRGTLKNYFKLITFQIFGLTTSLTNLNGWKTLLPNLAGKIVGVRDILRNKNINKKAQ